LGCRSPCVIRLAEASLRLVDDEWEAVGDR